MHLYYIGVSLNQVAIILLGNTLFGKIYPIKYFALVIDLALWRVQIFGNLLICRKRTPSKTQDATTHAVNGKNYTRSKTIELPISFNYGQSCFLKKTHLIALFQGLLCKTIPAIIVIPQLEFLDSLLSKTTFFKIGHPYSLTLLSLGQGGFEIITSKFVNQIQGFSLIRLSLLLRSLLGFFNLNIVFFGQIFNGLWIGKMFMLH